MASPWTRPAYPWVSPLASPWARRAGDVAPYHGCGHGAGVRTRRGAWALHGAERGRGRRPRRPAYTRAFPMAFPWMRRAGDVAPYHGCGRGTGVRTWRGGADVARGMVGADVPGGPRACGRSRWRPRGCGAPGTSRPTMGCGRGAGVRTWRGAWALRGAGHGRGRRPRRPAYPWAFPMASPWMRRAGDVAPYHVCAAGPTSKIRSDLILEVFRKLTAKHFRIPVWEKYYGVVPMVYVIIRNVYGEKSV